MIKFKDLSKNTQKEIINNKNFQRYLFDNALEFIKKNYVSGVRPVIVRLGWPNYLLYPVWEKYGYDINVFWNLLPYAPNTGKEFKEYLNSLLTKDIVGKTDAERYVISRIITFIYEYVQEDYPTFPGFIRKCSEELLKDINEWFVNLTMNPKYCLLYFNGELQNQSELPNFELDCDIEQYLDLKWKN